MSRVTTRSRVDLVADELRNAVASGSLGEGHRLNEIELATRLGVSRGSVREALQRMVQEGLVVVVPNRGMFVLEISPGDIVDIYDARRAIETSAALALLRPQRPDVIAALQEQCGLMSGAASSGNHADLTAADQRFHEILVDSLKNKRLKKATQTFAVETRLCLARLEGRYGAPQEAVQEHLDIVSAIMQGTAEDVLRAVDVHMDNAIKLLTDESAPTDVVSA